MLCSLRAAKMASLLLLVACAGRSAHEKPSEKPLAASAPSPRSERLSAPLRVHDVGFETPESVLHDAASDLYLVSNIAGSALATDDRAFISRVRPDGSVESLRFIDAQQANVELDAPKGMALIGEVLYVADVRFVRKFERSTGKPLGSIAIPGASFLNDLSADGSGGLYASDSGLGPGYTPSGNDAVHHIGSDGRVHVVARSLALGGPSGVLAGDDGLWVVSFGAGELFRLNRAGERSAVEKPPRGSLDGLAQFGGRLFVSSWEGAAVYERTDAGFVERFGGLDAPADLAVDEKRGRLLVTHYNENALSIHQL